MSIPAEVEVALRFLELFSGELPLYDTSPDGRPIAVKVVTKYLEGSNVLLGERRRAKKKSLDQSPDA